MLLYEFSSNLFSYLSLFSLSPSFPYFACQKTYFILGFTLCKAEQPP